MLCVLTDFNISLKELNRGELDLSYVYSQYFGMVIKKMFLQKFSLPFVIC